MNYDYTGSRRYCESIGLVWLGDNFVMDADEEAYKLNFTQEQMDAAMRHCLWHVKFLFNPRNYPWYARIGLAFHFLFGKMKK